MNNQHLYESSNTGLVVDQNARHQLSQKVKIWHKKEVTTTSPLRFMRGKQMCIKNQCYIDDVILY